jgi:hypothetical protein
MKSDEILIKTFDQVKNDNFDQVKFDQVIVCHIGSKAFTFLFVESNSIKKHTSYVVNVYNRF